MTEQIDQDCMREAIEEARMATKEGMMPFGAVVADEKGNILERAHNQIKTSKKRGVGYSQSEPTRHARWGRFSFN